MKNNYFFQILFEYTQVDKVKHEDFSINIYVYYFFKPVQKERVEKSRNSPWRTLLSVQSYLNTDKNAWISSSDQLNNHLQNTRHYDRRYPLDPFCKESKVAQIVRRRSTRARRKRKICKQTVRVRLPYECSRGLNVEIFRRYPATMPRSVRRRCGRNLSSDKNVTGQ